MSNLFLGIEGLNSKFKKLLEDDFKLVYIENKESKKEDNKKATKNDLSLFKIEKKRESIFEKITSVDSLDDVKKEIKNEYDKFAEEFSDYFDRVEEKLDDKQIRSFEIIEKTIKNRAKKLHGTIDKFKVEDSWNISRIQEEFYFKLQKNIKDVIDSLIPTILIGMRENSAYDGVLGCLNKFLSKLGIYTMDISMDEECNYELLSPQECDDCKTNDISKKDIIKEIISYPYILNEKQIVSEGKVIVWKVVHNG